VAVVEDLAVYVHEFGVDATVAAGTVPVIFDRDPGTSVGLVDQADPTATFVTADWPAVARGAEITIDATTYRVIGIEADGTGMSRARLALA